MASPGLKPKPWRWLPRRPPWRWPGRPRLQPLLALAHGVVHEEQDPDHEPSARDERSLGVWVDGAVLRRAERWKGLGEGVDENQARSNRQGGVPQPVELRVALSPVVDDDA